MAHTHGHRIRRSQMEKNWTAYVDELLFVAVLRSIAGQLFRSICSIQEIQKTKIKSRHNFSTRQRCAEFVIWRRLFIYQRRFQQHMLLESIVWHRVVTREYHLLIYQCKCVQCINELWSRVCNFHLAPQQTMRAPFCRSFCCCWSITLQHTINGMYTCAVCTPASVRSFHINGIVRCAGCRVWQSSRHANLLVLGWVAVQMCVGIFSSIRMTNAMCSHVFDKQNSARTTTLKWEYVCAQTHSSNGNHRLRLR